MVLALVLFTWSLAPNDLGVADAGATYLASSPSATSTAPPAARVPAFTCRSDRPDHALFGPEEPPASLVEREESSSFKAVFADFTTPPLSSIDRSGMRYGIGARRPHDGFLPLIQTVLLRC